MASGERSDLASCCVGTVPSRFFRRNRRVRIPLRHDREAATALAQKLRKGAQFESNRGAATKGEADSAARREVVSGAGFGAAAHCQSRRQRSGSPSSNRATGRGMQLTRNRNPPGDRGHSAEGGRNLAPGAGAWASFVRKSRERRSAAVERGQFMRNRRMASLSATRNCWSVGGCVLAVGLARRMSWNRQRTSRYEHCFRGQSMSSVSC